MPERTTNCHQCKKLLTWYEVPSRKDKGKFCSHRCAALFRNTFTDNFIHVTGEKNYQWKGDKASYFAIHAWVKRHKGKPSTCFICKGRCRAARFEWANASGKYKRDLNDYVSLCSVCHRRGDMFMRMANEY